jgi:hypothetical protein
MANGRKREAVTISFHYLTRQTAHDEGIIEVTPFTQAEFNTLGVRLKGLPPFDTSDDKLKNAVRLKKAVPIEAVELINARTIFGLYRAAYWGHAYDNTAVGKIPADSISFRQFYFILYLSKSGRIYLGVQYLGQFGSYEGLRNTITGILPGRKDIVAHSFRRDAALFQDVEPSEVKVRVAKKPDSIAGENVFSDGAMITFKKPSRDSAFGEEVKKRLLPLMGTSTDAIKKAAAEILDQSGLLDVEDADIADCTVIGQVNGKRKTVYMIEQGLFATQFPIKTSFNADGHPEVASAKAEMIKLLDKQIISLAENA